jgi:hypothetical protein
MATSYEVMEKQLYLDDRNLQQSAYMTLCTHLSALNWFVMKQGTILCGATILRCHLSMSCAITSTSQKIFLESPLLYSIHELGQTTTLLYVCCLQGTLSKKMVDALFTRIGIQVHEIVTCMTDTTNRAQKTSRLVTGKGMADKCNMHVWSLFWATRPV